MIEITEGAGIKLKEVLAEQENPEYLLARWGPRWRMQRIYLWNGL